MNKGGANLSLNDTGGLSENLVKEFQTHGLTSLTDCGILALLPILYV